MGGAMGSIAQITVCMEFLKVDRWIVDSFAARCERVCARFPAMEWCPVQAAFPPCA